MMPRPSRRSVLLAGLAAPFVAATPAGAATSSGAGTRTFGSGVGGPWQHAGRSVSVAKQIVPARTSGVWAFGDSILVADGRDLSRLLHARTGLGLAVNSWSSRPTAPAVDALAEWVQAYGAPRIVVMATGTNDIFSPPVMAGQIERVMGLVPTAQVLWVNVHARRWKRPTATQLYDVQNSGWVNAQIAEAAGVHPNLHVVRWSEYVSSPNSSGSLNRPVQLLSDGVHTTPTGRQVRNELIVRAVEAVR